MRASYFATSPGAQIFPADKHAIIHGLQAKGHVVGMTGDVSRMMSLFAPDSPLAELLAFSSPRKLSLCTCTGGERCAGTQAGRSRGRRQQRHRCSFCFVFNLGLRCMCNAVNCFWPALLAHRRGQERCQRRLGGRRSQGTIKRSASSALSQLLRAVSCLLTGCDCTRSRGSADPCTHRHL
jgi:hypothetical protein